nr:dephospho-CoA kinase [Saprospiraceae bacterium]
MEKDKKRTLKIGVTGGIGSGKTTVCKIFENLGTPVYYADDRAKAILMGDKEVRKELRDSFGEEVFDSEHNPDKKALASVVFSDKEKLQKLNSIIHPRVAEDWEKWFKSHKGRTPYVLKEAALLFESGSAEHLDEIICVIAPEDLRIARVMERDGVTEGEVLNRMKNQMPQDLKASLSQFLIINDQNTSLVKQVVSLHRKLIKRDC